MAGATPTLEGMPEEVRQHILMHVSGPAPVDFYVLTATEQQSNLSKPVSGLNNNDVVVRGFPVGPMLYVTEVVPLVPGRAPTSAPHAHSPIAHTLGQHEVAVAVRAAPGRLAPPVDWAVEMRTNDLDALADSLTESWAGGRRIGRTTTPRQSDMARDIGQAGHFLFATPNGQLYLNATAEEDSVTRLRYHLGELSCSRITGHDMGAVRVAAIKQKTNVELDPKSTFLRIPKGRVVRTASGNTTKLLKLNSTFAIEVDVPIVATLPILSKIEVPTPDRMPAALNEDPTMRGRIGLETNKWLACVPAEWVHQQQAQAFGAASSFALAERIEAVRQKVEQHRDASTEVEHLRYLHTAGRTLPRVAVLGPRDLLAPGADGQLVMADVLAQGEGDTHVHDEHGETWRKRHIFGTSFKTLAPALVCTFFDRENAVVTDITNPELVRQLLAKAEKQDFQQQYGLRSSLMCAVKPGHSMRATTKERCAKRAGNPLKRFLKGRARPAQPGPSAA